MKIARLLSLLLLLPLSVMAEEISRIWLTHQTNDPSKLVVNWHTAEAGDSTVEFGETGALGQSMHRDEAALLHHLEVPLVAGKALHYRVRSGGNASQIYAIQGYPAGELRVAVFADTGYMKASAGEAIERDRPHL